MARGLTALSRTEGQFALLLDDGFGIIWHTSSLTTILGFEDVVGRNGIEFVHPDDVELVVDLLSKLGQRDGEATVGPWLRPDPTNVRICTSMGGWLPMEATTYDLSHDPEVRGLLIVCKMTVDRSDVGRSIELLGTGADVREVLACVARLVDRAMGTDSRSALAWWNDSDVRLVWSPEGHLPDPRMGEAARKMLRVGVTEALTITDLTDPRLHGAGEPARGFGYTVASLLPIAAPASGDVIGCLLCWGHHPVELGLHPQMPLHIGLRIAALAIMDGRTKTDLRWAASHDSLTMLINRAEFARRLERLNGDDVALLYIDLDDFKPINDSHGHSTGDAVLIEVAARIRETVGATGITCRLGGDEFAVAQPGLADVSHGWALADRIVTAVRQPIRIGKLTVAVSASIGVAMGAHPLIPSILIQRADEALLEAKSSGKNTVKIAN